jgi:hypothetical protein
MNTNARAEILTSARNPTAELRRVPQGTSRGTGRSLVVVVVHRAWADGSNGARLGRPVGPAGSALITRGMKAS